MGLKKAVFLGVGLFIVGFSISWWTTGIGNVSTDLMILTSIIFGAVFGAIGWKHGIESD